MGTSGTAAGYRASRADIERAVAILHAGGVVAIPTDTVYGLAASLDHPAAIERIFTIKGRAETKALPVLVSSSEVVPRLARAVTDPAQRLVRAFWPGALTIVVDATQDVPDVVLRGGTTVGLRMPDNADALAIIAGAGGALAVTSANHSGEIEARSASEVVQALGPDIDFVVDGGASKGTVPSTVVDATRTRLRVLRHGAIDIERLMEVVNERG